MKKIVIVDGGPRKNFNTAAMLQKFAEGAMSAGEGVENSNGYGSMEPCIAAALGAPERLIAYNTYQVKDYGRFELGGFSEEAKRRYRDEHWEEDLQRAFEAGKRMAEELKVEN